MIPFFKKILLQILTSAILEDKKNTFKICAYRNKKLIKKLEKTFDRSEQLIAFIKNYGKKFFPYYIVLFLDSEEQGILPSGEQNCGEFGIGKISTKTLPLANVLLYTATEHVEYFSELYEDYGGLGFLFSPFALPHSCTQKEQKDDKTRLYAFRNSQNLALVVYKNGEVLTGSYKLFEKTLSFQFDGFDDGETLGDDGLSTENTPLEEGEEKKEDEITLDNFNEMLGDKIDALDQEQSDGESIIEKPQEDVEMDDLGKFGADMEICRFIISSIESLYRDSHYGGDFIDELVIFSDEMLLQSILEFVKSEISLKPQIRLIDTHGLMQRVMQKELKYDL